MRSKAILMALLALAFGGVEAVPVSSNEAATAARALSVSAAAFGARLGTSVANVTQHHTTNDAPFYAVKMKEGGTVFLSGDTEDQPIIAFTACDADYSTIDKRSPLWALLNRDVSARKDLRARNTKPATAAASWERLCAAGAGDISKPLTAARPVFPSAAGGGDLRVDALVQSQWAQDGWDGTYDGEPGGDPSKRCYSYYTPELRDGKHAVCGCVATAMSQVMRYHQYPVAAKRVTKTCFVEPRYEMNEESGNAEFVGETNLTTSAEYFDWANMTLRPKNEDMVSETVCQAIGRLTSDAGISVCMNYDTLDNGGSGAFMPNAATALRDVFQYQSASVFSAYEVTDAPDALKGAFFANFDAGYPVLLGISGNGGHAIVADGYGFITEKNMKGEDVTLPYVHLNMGWSGDSDFWYNLPDMTAVGFNTVDEVVFNIFPDKGGDTAIVSGRVLDDDKQPVAGAEVKVFKAGTRELVTNVTTSATGVYGVTVPSSKNYDIEAVLDSKVGEKADVTAVYTTVHDGTFNGLILDDDIHDPVVRTYSAKQATKVGNSWGNDVTISEPTVKVTTSHGEALCTTLVKALWTAGELAATQEGEAVDIELLKPVSLPTDWTIGFDCTIRTAGDPSACAVTRAPGAEFVVASAARVLFTNVVFSAGDTALRVENGGIAALAGKVRMDEISLASSGFLEIAGPLDRGYSYRVRQDGGAALNTVFGGASVDLATASAYANLFVNAVNDELVGVASAVGGGVQLAWGIGEVPDSATVVRLLQDDTSVNFLSLASALKFVTNNAEVVVLKDCVLTTNVVVSGKKMTIRSETGAVVSPSASRDDIESFVIENGGELVLSNVVFRGFSKFGEDGVAGNVFVKVMDGSRLRMLDGAGLENIVNTYRTYGAVKVEKGGQVDLEAGSFIRGCSSEKYGGAVYLAANAKLNLAGCSITGCTAATGGGVYAVKGAAVTVSNATVVAENTQGGSSAGQSNIYFAGSQLATCPLTVLDGLEGASVGVYYSDGSRASEKGELAVFDADVADEAKTSAADAFVNDLHPDGYYTGYSAYVSDDKDKNGLVWGPPRAEPGEVPEAEGKVVLDRAGKVMYFAELLPAFDRLTGGVARVTLKADVEIDKEGDCPVLGQVTVDGAGYRIGRDNGCRLYIKGANNALTLTNVTLTGSTLQNAQGGNRSLVRVEDGGLFVLEDGTVVRDVAGFATGVRTVAAVSIWNADFTMRGGSVISNCVNYCDSGAGGGVIVAGTNSVFRFEGGLITDCKVTEGTGAGVQIDNTSQFIVSGDGTITNNVGKGGVESNVYVSDLSYLLLADAFTGSIGYTEGIKGDTNVFGRVAADCPAPLEDQASSAMNFFRDIDHSVTGVLVTNETERLLVWSTAVADGKYVDKDGNEYGEVEVAPPPPPPPPQEWTVVTNQPTPIAFRSIDRVSDTEWALVITNRVEYCNYRLIWTDDLTRGFVETGKWEHAVGPAADSVWATNVVTTGGVWFWRAEGTEGTNMVPPQVSIP